MRMPEQPALRPSRVRRWIGHLFREWTIESWRPIAPASAKPEPSQWSDAQLTLAWIGHSTVLINFFGVTILTDPVLCPRIGIRLLGFTIGPKRLTAPALGFDELPKVDLVLLSHAHFDHLDLRTLRCFDEFTSVITARATRDLLKRTRFSHVTELDWGQRKTLSTAAGKIEISAFPVKHWGARMQRDMHRGYNGYLIQRSGSRIIFAGDTAITESFSDAAATRPNRRRNHVDRRLQSVDTVRTARPEQAIEMANAAGARFILPVHHQTFRLSFEPFREPIERFEAELSKTPERIALREIGETFVLPL